MKKSILAMLLLGVFVIAGCGDNHETALSAVPPLEPYPVTVVNMSHGGKRTDLHFQKEPKRVVVTRASAADTLIAMGAGDTVVAAYLPEVDNPVKEGYNKLLPHADILPDLPTPEKIKAYRPDLIIGGCYDFEANKMGDTDQWIQEGIPAYIEENTDPDGQQDYPDVPDPGEEYETDDARYLLQKEEARDRIQGEENHNHNMSRFDMDKDEPDSESPLPGTIDAEFSFISHMGDIFNKPMEAEQLADRIIGEIEMTQAHVAGNQPETAMIVEFTEGKIKVYGPRDLPGHMAERLAAKVLGESGAFITPEELKKKNPDVLFVVYPKGPNGKKMTLSLLQMSAFGNMRAVEKKRVYGYPKRFTEATGSHTVEALRILRNGLYPGMSWEKT